MPEGLAAEIDHKRAMRIPAQDFFKVDLIDDKDLKKWEEYFLENKIADHFIAISVEKGTNISELRRVINVIYEEKILRFRGIS